MAFSWSNKVHDQQDLVHHHIVFHNIFSLCNPAFTEASFVACHAESFTSTARRLSDDEKASDFGVFSKDRMDLAASQELQRSASHHSHSSVRSHGSHTLRKKPRKHASYMSSSASSISDKSLTSFPSFSPESPQEERSWLARTVDGIAHSSRKPSDPHSIVESLMTSSPSAKSRTALFEDAPLSSQNVPGALHNASDEHIERLIARNGAVALVRQIAEDLARRDAQISAFKRKAEGRERALRKIILECGLSSLDLETRLRAIEGERFAFDGSQELILQEDGLEDLMSDAMDDTVVLGRHDVFGHEGVLRATESLRALETRHRTASRTWKDYIWGTGTSNKPSPATSVNGEATNGVDTATVRPGGVSGRQSVLQDGLFQPAETSSSASSTIQFNNGNNHRERKPSSGIASLALKLVAGNATGPREADSATGRGRASSTGTAPGGRKPSSNSARTTMSAKIVPIKQVSKAIPAHRPTAPASAGPGRALPHDRWDTMGASPQGTTLSKSDNSGPVEMDTILPLEAQPPTSTQAYNNPYGHEFLTDRFGFIYDQRRKKRQKEAAEKMQKHKRGSRVEMLSSARSGIQASLGEEDDNLTEDRPDSRQSTDDITEDGKPAKRWHEYLNVATFPTELLSHTPSGSMPGFEVMEGGDVPKSPGITTEERGFLPSASITAAPPAVSVISDIGSISKAAISTPVSAEFPKEDPEPVKLLLEQLGEVHDSLQREKTIRWNDFLRKVRAERKRDGEAAAAALAATSDSRSQRSMAIMPEATLTDGEMIGVAGLGNKGKVGRAKWNEFKALVLGGIPVAYRAKIWAECSGAAALRIPGYYEDLVARNRKDDDPAIIAQIQMDINRTLTDNVFFRKGPGVAKLNEVLLAYSRRNAEVGYCQGMNLITACLLLIMPTAEDAFWVLTSIIENILPRGYYDHSLLASRADQQVLRQYVAQILPKLSAHLDDLSIELEALTFQWFLSVFTDCLSAEALFRVWDIVFCTNDGSTFLFQVALALLKLNESQLLQCNTPASVYTYINHQMTNHAISIDGLIHASEGLRKVVKRDEVENRRAKAIQAEKALIKQREAKNKLRKAERLAALSGNSTDSQVRGDAITSIINDRAQSHLAADENGELVVRSPIPVEDERDGQLG